MQSPEDHMAGMVISNVNTANVSQPKVGSWIIDTGASDHMCFQLHLMQNLTKLVQPVILSMPTGHTIVVSHIGNVVLTF